MNYGRKGVRNRQKELNAHPGRWGKKITLFVLELFLAAVVSVGVIGAAVGYADAAWRMVMREMEFKMERQGLLKAGDRVTVTEGVLPSNYYYTIDPALAMSGNYPFRERMLAREGIVREILEKERGFYVIAEFDE